MSLPGFTAETALTRSSRPYASPRRAEPGGGLRPAADDSDPPGVHCYYASPFCVNHEWLVNCDQWSGGVPRRYTKVVGSCEGGTGGGGGGSFSGRSGGSGRDGSGFGGTTGGITIDGGNCDPTSGDPDCRAVVVSRR